MDGVLNDIWLGELDLTIIQDIDVDSYILFNYALVFNV